MAKNSYFLVFVFLLFLGLATPAVAGRVSALQANSPSPSDTPVVEVSATFEEVTPSLTSAPMPTNTPIPPTSTTPATSTPTPTPLPMVVPLIVNEPTPVGFGPEKYPFYINPLTGLLVGDPEILDRRPMAIKVTNHPRYVRPQAGLSKADIIFEYYMENGIPRFIAVFYGQDAEKVGPVRSGRLFDEHVFRMYDAMFVFGNADTRVMDYFQELEDHIVDSLIVESDYDHQQTCSNDPPNRLCRDRELDGYNTMFANTTALEGYYDRVYGNYRPDLTGMYFTYRVPLSNMSGLNIRVRYSLMVYSKWEYSMELGQYLRYQETQGHADPDMESYAPHQDVLTGEQLTAENVVVLIVPHEYYTKTAGSEIMKIFLQGRGRAVVFRDGFAYEAEWVRPRNGGVLQLYTPEGDPFPLKPGQTWYEVMSQDSEINHKGMDWRFSFVLPLIPNGRVNLHGDDPLGWFFRGQNPYRPLP